MADDEGWRIPPRSVSVCAMGRVTGIGGVFFKTRDKAATLEWYRRHLGIDVLDFGYAFRWRTTHGDPSSGYTVWAPFAADTAYFEPSREPIMVNFRVDGIEELIARLRAEGVQVVGDIVSEPNGKFGWIIDLDGRKIELWEPVPPDQDPYLPG